MARRRRRKRRGNPVYKKDAKGRNRLLSGAAARKALEAGSGFLAPLWGAGKAADGPVWPGQERSVTAHPKRSMASRVSKLRSARISAYKERGGGLEGFIGGIVNAVEDAVDSGAGPAAGSKEDFLQAFADRDAFERQARKDIKGKARKKSKGVIGAVQDVVEGVVETVTGGASPGTVLRGKRAGKRKKRFKFNLLKGRKFGKSSKLRLLKLGAPNIRRGPGRGLRVMINPIGRGGIAGVAVAALGAGAGYVVAQRVVPNFVGKYVPSATTGLIGVAVGALGGIAVSRVVGRWKPALGSRMALGSLVALGVGLVSALLRYVPSSITAPAGLSGVGRFGDYLQLSGPVPADLFAGGLNGMADYVDFASPAAGAAAQAISQVETAWAPSAGEQF